MKISPLLLLFLFIGLAAPAQTGKKPKSKNKSESAKRPMAGNPKPEKKIEYWDAEKKHKKSEEFLLNGKQHGKCSYWYQNDKLARSGSFIEGKEDGFWVYYYDDGKKKAEEYYIEGVKFGRAKYWYKSGQQAMICRYVGNVADSTWVSWYENGQIKSNENFKAVWVNFRWGTLKQGQFRYWRENGTPESDGFFVNDTLHGPYSSWHPNGKMRETG
ncbi:MAG: toxin-antitoxin system YwqK family antitoxin, partial [Bacteroidia bacterium]